MRHSDPHEKHRCWGTLLRTFVKGNSFLQQFLAGNDHFFLENPTVLQHMWSSFLFVADREKQKGRHKPAFSMIVHGLC